LNPEWVEFPAAYGVARLNPNDTPLLAVGRYILSNTSKTLG
jgi:hypothetical protein